MDSRKKALVTFAVYSKARDRRKVTDYWVAKEIGVRPSVICDWKHGRSTPKLDKLSKIANVLGIPLDAFVVE